MGRVWMSKVAYDTPIQVMESTPAAAPTLWSARAVKSSALEAFNTGDYYKVEDEVTSADRHQGALLNDEPEAGKRLRLLQQHFFVSCSLQHVLQYHGRPRARRLGARTSAVCPAAQRHSPSIGVAELMRLLIDERKLDWEEAWTSPSPRSPTPTTRCCPRRWKPGRWRCSGVAAPSPRDHLRDQPPVSRRGAYPRRQRAGPPDVADRRGHHQFVRMAHLATVGSHAVNGVAALHTELLKGSAQRLLQRVAGTLQQQDERRDTALLWRWPIPASRELLDRTIGEGWLTDLGRLRGLAE